MLAEMMMGHLIGDYLFQTDWMSKNKIKDTFKGWCACGIHSLIYTNCVYVATVPDALETGIKYFYWYILIFASHFIIDKWSLAKVWMTGALRIDCSKVEGFIPLKYAVIDNTMHLAIMWYYMSEVL